MNKEEAEKLRELNIVHVKNEKDMEIIPKFCKCNKLIKILLSSLTDLEHDAPNWEHIIWLTIGKLKELEKHA